MFRIIQGVLEFIVILIIIRFVMNFFTGGRAQQSRTWSRPRPGAAPRERAGGTLVRDPQCGTYLPEARAVRLTRGGSVLHFCSETCRDQYAAGHS